MIPKRLGHTVHVFRRRQSVGIDVARASKVKGRHREELHIWSQPLLVC